MKIASAAMGTAVSGHFGRCENFIIFEVENNTIVNETSIPNPGHRPGFLPNFIADMGVTVVFSGGMGGGAFDIFEERGVEVVVGVQGEARAAVEAYLRGELKSTGAVCNHHHHDHEGGCGSH